MNDAAYTLDRAVAQYLQLRQQKQEIRDEAAEKTAAIAARMEKLEVALQQYMERVGLESLPTQHGTVYTSVTYRASVTDWDAVLEFIQYKQAWHLLTKKVSDVAVRELAEIDVIVPGTKLTGTIRVNVRSK